MPGWPIPLHPMCCGIRRRLTCSVCLVALWRCLSRAVWLHGARSVVRTSRRFSNCLFECAPDFTAGRRGAQTISLPDTPDRCGARSGAGSEAPGSPDAHVIALLLHRPQHTGHHGVIHAPATAPARRIARERGQPSVSESRAPEANRRRRYPQHIRDGRGGEAVACEQDDSASDNQTVCAGLCPGPVHHLRTFARSECDTGEIPLSSRHFLKRPTPNSCPKDAAR